MSHVLIWSRSYVHWERSEVTCLVNLIVYCQNHESELWRYFFLSSIRQQTISMKGAVQRIEPRPQSKSRLAWHRRFVSGFALLFVHSPNVLHRQRRPMVIPAVAVFVSQKKVDSLNNVLYIAWQPTRSGIRLTNWTHTTTYARPTRSRHSERACWKGAN